jgi:dihydrofolate reductase
MLNVIVAHCKNRGIGINNTIPWKSYNDLKIFKKLTIGDGNNAVIMGRKTWESLPEKFRPLPDRINIVLSKTLDKCEGAVVKKSLFGSMEYCKINNINGWVIGGSSLYKEVIFGEMGSTVYVTDIVNDFKCDTFFTELPQKYRLISQSCWIKEGDLTFRYKTFTSL